MKKEIEIMRFQVGKSKYRFVRYEPYEALLKKYELVKKDNAFLLIQQDEIKKLAESSGGKLATWKHKALKLQDKIEKLK